MNLVEKSKTINLNVQKMSEALNVLSQPGKRSVREMRKLILGLEAAMQAMPEYVPGDQFKTTHRFEPCIYIREAFIPKGMVVTGRIHTTSHLNILSQGKITVWTEEGMKTLTASTVIKSDRGIKRVGLTHEDTVWITVHHNPTDERDLKKVEDRLFAENFDEAYLKSQRTFEDAAVFLGFTPQEIKKISENESDLIPFEQYQDSVFLSQSDIHGFGMFARKTIEIGETIGEGRINGKRTPLGRYCNHSGDPNIEMIQVQNEDVTVVARKRIVPGEELFNDYYLSFVNTRPLNLDQKGDNLCHL